MSKRHNPRSCTDELCEYCDGYDFGFDLDLDALEREPSHDWIQNNFERKSGF